MKFLSRRKRPPHLGPYPMEKIRRVDKTTTLITGNIKRVPKRASFFVRSRFGDLGPGPAREIGRFVTKYPLSRSIGRIHWKQVPIHDGDTAPRQAPISDDPEELARHIKSMCYFLDADMVGICEMPEWAWYSHDLDGTPIEARHKYAIVLLIDQGFHTMEASSGDDWISSAQSYRAYLKGSTIACVVADYIRQLGFSSKAHSNAHGDVQQIPLMLLAGLGEMSRIGEVVLNPFVGPRHKIAVITTDLPLAVDKPIDFGLQDFCDKCRKCARECPAGAIPFGDKVLYNGYEIWKPDVESCVRYRVTNLKGSACGRCMKMCPFNKEGLLHHRLALWMAINWPFSRRLLIWLDDALGYGTRNPLKKWWFDLVNRDGEVVRPEKTNARDVDPDRPVNEDKKIAIYTPENLPPADSMEPYPVDRKQATRDGEAAARALADMKRAGATD